MNIAIIGGGLAGVCVALELAEAGCKVDIYEEKSDLISQASFVNEGKVHLGFVYAKDRSLRTARKMMEGAMTFIPILSRWFESKDLEHNYSTRFLYAVHRESMVSKEEILDYFTQIRTVYQEKFNNHTYRYLGKLSPELFSELSHSELNSQFNTEYISHAFLTEERSIDPIFVAQVLKKIVYQHPGINVFLGTKVERCEIQKTDKIKVHCVNQGKQGIIYDHVVNVSWQNRRAIDLASGLKDKRSIINRYKVALHSNVKINFQNCPSVTFIHGSFGDSVQFAERIYLSWYPEGLIYSDTSDNPLDPYKEMNQLHTEKIIRNTIKELSNLLPQLTHPSIREVGNWEVKGGFISALGTTGIDDPTSKLHDRYEVGVKSTGNFHSVDTGKYTLAPLIAHQTAYRILNKEMNW